MCFEERSQNQESLADHPLPRQRQSLFVSCWHAICCAFTPLCVIGVDQYNRNQEAHRRESPELATEDFTNVTHRTDLTASGDRMRDSETAKPLLNCHKRLASQQKLEKQYFVSRSPFKQVKGSTLVCRDCAPLRSDPNANLVCVLKDIVRIGPVPDSRTTILAGSHSVEILVPSKKNLHNCSLGTHRWKFQSLRLSNTRFGAIRC